VRFPAGGFSLCCGSGPTTVRRSVSSDEPRRSASTPAQRLGKTVAFLTLSGEIECMGSGHRKRAARVGWVVYLALTGALALGCGETADKGADGSNGGGNSGGDTTSSGTSGSTATLPSSIESLDDLLRATAAIACRSECAGASAIEFYYREDCLEAFTLVYEALGASIQRSIAAGNMSFDAAEGQRCIDALANGACNLDAPNSACDKVFVGNLPVGGACTQSDECAGGGYCNDTLACPGVCEGGLSAGTPCTDASGVCQSGLTCLPEGVCGARQANGEPCANNSECESYYCDDDDDDGAGLCANAPQGFSKTLGEVCEESYYCAADLYCDVAATVPSCAPAAKIGEACVRDDIDKSCVRAAYCLLEADEVQGVCVERVPLHGACAASNECAVGVCDGGTCEKHSGLGEPCVTDARCFDVCDGGVCAIAPACPPGE